MLLGILISLITHVDDLYAAGEGKKYNETIASMEKLLHLTVKKGEFRFCGKNVKQDSERADGRDRGYRLHGPARAPPQEPIFTFDRGRKDIL